MCRVLDYWRWKENGMRTTPLAAHSYFRYYPSSLTDLPPAVRDVGNGGLYFYFLVSRAGGSHAFPDLTSSDRSFKFRPPAVPPTAPGPKADLRTIQRPTPSDSTEHDESTITLEEFERVSVLCQSEFPFQGLGSRLPCVVVRRADLPMMSIQRL